MNPAKTAGHALHFAFGAAYGMFIALALLKLGNPVVLARMIQPPEGLFEIVYMAWPMDWGYALITVLAILGLVVGVLSHPEKPSILSSPTRPSRLITGLRWLPVIWLIIQFISATQTIDAKLTRSTLPHFIACGVCFYLGHLALNRTGTIKPFWIAIAIGFVLVLWSGFQQHYGGLEAVRTMVYQDPNWQQKYPPEYLHKIGSNRIFATLVYPNALAGAILLLLPPLLTISWSLLKPISQSLAMLIVGTLGYASATCLYWSGSKAGWLIALTLAFLALLHQPFPRRLKVLLTTLVLVAGLAGFMVKFQDYFARGAKSVGARFDYWTAAARTFQNKPLFGSGPGTFSVAYRQIKPPEAEMARLTHNDFLEQASDSGVFGFLSYLTLHGGVLFALYRKSRPAPSPLAFAVWLGLLGWTLQSTVEFGLYIPALAWPAFTLLGWACAYCHSTPPAKGSDPHNGWIW